MTKFIVLLKIELIFKKLLVFYLMSYLNKIFYGSVLLTGLGLYYYKNKNNNKKLNNKEIIIYDNVHGEISIDRISKMIIDTPFFQRLRNIKQTGCLSHVFITAIHTRFEHSIGTYHLARKFMESLNKNQPELNISSRLILLVSIAGLCHDLGHLMYSHLFDDLFLKKLPNYKSLGKFVHHEERSKMFLKFIVKKYNIPLNNQEVYIICDLISPTDDCYNYWPDNFKVGKWIFQIVSNPINNIDVDKFDYITRDNKAVGLNFGFQYTRLINQARVYNDNIHYPYQVRDNIYNMFHIRYRLHRQIYNHKTVKAIEILLLEAMFELEKDDKISEYINVPEKMLKLIDNYLYFSDNDKIKNIMNKIDSRNIPIMIYENISKKSFKIFDDKIMNIPVIKDTIKVIKFKVGYTSGKDKNPLNNISFYNTKTLQVINIDSTKEFSMLINQNHQEYYTRLYCLNRNNVEEVKKILHIT